MPEQLLEKWTRVLLLWVTGTFSFLLGAAYVHVAHPSSGSIAIIVIVTIVGVVGEIISDYVKFKRER